MSSLPGVACALTPSASCSRHASEAAATSASAATAIPRSPTRTGEEVKIQLGEGLADVEGDDRWCATRDALLYPKGRYTGPMADGAPAAQSPVPGVVVVWSGAHARRSQAFRIPAGGLVIGRELLENTTDDRISRQHARVMWRDRRFIVTDLGSRNGTYAGGHPLVDREVTVTAPSVVRTGRTVCVLLEDIRQYEGSLITMQHDAIVGASTIGQWKALEALAAEGTNVLLLGEPGTGKGRMARGYAKMRNRPEAVFNPTIQAVPLERVVGPTIETLILEQVGKLGGPNLAMLVKLLDTRPAMRVVTTAVMALENLGLPPDLCEKLATKRVHLPPLRDRPDEMAHLVHDAVRGAEPGVQIHSTLIEACLLRPWPGNSRELINEVGRAAHTVAAQGKNNIRGEDIDNDAGHLMIGAPTLNAAVTAHRRRKQRKKKNVDRTPAARATDRLIDARSSEHVLGCRTARAISRRISDVEIEDQSTSLSRRTARAIVEKRTLGRTLERASPVCYDEPLER